MSSVRIAVVGVSGSGKSTFAKRLSEKLALEWLELDALYHLENWTPSPPEDMRRAVFEFMQSSTSWVIDGNYGLVRASVWSEATHVIWIDLPRHQLIPRLLKRSAQRIIARKRLWNENREGISALFSTDPKKNVWLHAWQSHPKIRRQYSADCVDPKWNHLRFVRVRTLQEVEDTFDALCSQFRKRGS